MQTERKQHSSKKPKYITRGLVHFISLLKSVSDIFSQEVTMVRLDINFRDPLHNMKNYQKILFSFCFCSRMLDC